MTWLLLKTFPLKWLVYWDPSWQNNYQTFLQLSVYSQMTVNTLPPSIICCMDVSNTFISISINKSYIVSKATILQHYDTIFICICSDYASINPHVKGTVKLGYMLIRYLYRGQKDNFIDTKTSKSVQRWESYGKNNNFWLLILDTRYCTFNVWCLVSKFKYCLWTSRKQNFLKQ